MLGFIKKLLGIKTINFSELKKNGAIIIDVRTKGEFAGGHIKGSLNIPLNTINQNLKLLKDKNQPIITCCASGARSASAKSILSNNGYSQVYNGGGWMSLNNKI